MTQRTIHIVFLKGRHSCIEIGTSMDSGRKRDSRHKTDSDPILKFAQIPCPFNGDF
jgi:hypothetical protein